MPVVAAVAQLLQARAPDIIPCMLLTCTETQEKRSCTGACVKSLMPDNGVMHMIQDDLELWGGAHVMHMHCMLLLIANFTVIPC